MPSAAAVPDLLAAALATLRPGPAQVVLAVSGGADSVALACAWTELLRRGVRQDALSIAHFDHRQRPESAADAAWVAAFAAKLGLPCQLGAWRDAPPQASEAAARAARCRFLADAAAALPPPEAGGGLEWGAGVPPALPQHATPTSADVALAHTHDDQAETILLAILRGAGMRGLAGMRAERRLPFAPAGIRLLRPLLGVRRAALREYLAARGQDWREDASNVDPRFRRNRLRHELLPALRANFNPRVDDALVRLAGHAEGAAADLDRRADRFLARHETPAGLPLAELGRVSLPARADVFRRWWERRGWPRGRMGEREWSRLAALLDRRDRGLQLPGGLAVRKRRGMLTVLPAGAPPPADAIRPEEPSP